VGAAVGEEDVQTLAIAIAAEAADTGFEVSAIDQLGDTGEQNGHVESS
jgi:hypothetical protein